MLTSPPVFVYGHNFKTIYVILRPHNTFVGTICQSISLLALTVLTWKHIQFKEDHFELNDFFVSLHKLIGSHIILDMCTNQQCCLFNSPATLVY